MGDSPADVGQAASLIILERLWFGGLRWRIQVVEDLQGGQAGDGFDGVVDEIAEFVDENML